MPAYFPERDAHLSWVSSITIHFWILCVVAIAVVLLSITNPALALDLRAGSYLSPASVPVTTEHLAAVPREVPLAMGTPSRILLIGNDKMAMGYRSSPQFITAKAVVHAAVKEIRIVKKVDQEFYIPDAGGSPRILTMKLD